MDFKSKRYIVLDWEQLELLTTGASPYPAVNARRNGLKRTNLGYKSFHGEHNLFNPDILIDIRKYTSWFQTVLEITDLKKFMLARIKHGI